MINYYKVSIKGKNVYHFFDRILNEKINMFDIIYNKNIIIFKISYEDYIKLKQLNTIYTIDIISVNGIKKYQKILKFYKLFIIFFLTSLLFIIIYSNMIFKIEIDTDNEILKEIIKKELKKQNITIFNLKKSSYQLQKVKQIIKNNNKDMIEWIEIEKVGVIYKITIVERISNNKNILLKKNNIIASKNGIIKDMYIISGQILKNPGDYVKKGEIIVSGKITKNDDVKNVVNSVGKVYAEVWYKINLSTTLSTKVQKDKDGMFYFDLKLFGKQFSIFKYKIKNMKENKSIVFFNNNTFSILLRKEYIENLIPKKLNVSDVVNKLELKAQKELEKNLKEGEKILLQKTLKIITNNDRINVEVFFKIYEDIAEQKEIASS